MARKPITLKGFIKGINLKGDCLGDPGIMRLTGFKFGSRIGVLETRGGFADWDTVVQEFTHLNGIKKWYREDGGSNYFTIGTSTTIGRRLFLFNPEDKSAFSIADLTSLLMDDLAPVQFVNCNSQLLILPLMSVGRPFCVKLILEGLFGGIFSQRSLGLDPPTLAPFLNAIGVSPAGVNQMPRNQIQEGSYIYGYTYSYGTKDNPEKYGESAMSPLANINYPASTAGYIGTPDHNGIIQIAGWDTVTTDGIVKRVNIYRSKRNLTSLFKIGEYKRLGVASDNFNDTLNDSLIDLSKTPPAFTGLPTAMRCAMWHPTFQRLYWFGQDGYFHWSAAGKADINPFNQRMEVGSLGYYGNGIATIRNAIYTFKEDGIYIIQGESPNYFSTKVSNVQCFSRGSISEMPDGIYFLGVESGKIKVYRFNGNIAEPITEDISDLLPDSKSSVFKRAYARRVGDEYWISLMIMSKRFCNHPVPYNNVILMYDYRYSQWSGSLPCQASSIEVLDGPGDSGEVFITESDPTNDSSKGNFFRFEKRGGKCNKTVYTSGSRVYTKLADVPGLITYGTIPAFSEEDSSLEELSVFGCKIRTRGYVETFPTAQVYDDTLALDQLIIPSTTAEIARMKKNDYTLTGITAPVVGTGKVGSATCFPTLVQDFEFSLKDDKLRTGVIVDLNFGSREGKFIEVEALEFLFSPTNNP